MLNNLRLPEISKQIYTQDTLKVLTESYQSIAPIWTSHQMEWMCSIYSSFKDHDKFLILIYLTNKTLDFYSSNLIKLTYDEFYSKESIEIEDFNITEVAKNLNIPKESVRRKVSNLCKKKYLGFSTKEGLTIGDNLESTVRKIAPKDLSALIKVIISINENGGIEKLKKFR